MYGITKGLGVYEYFYVTFDSYDTRGKLYNNLTKTNQSIYTEI